MSAIDDFLAMAPQPSPPYPVILLKRSTELAVILDGVPQKNFIHDQELMDATARVVQIISDVVERLSSEERSQLLDVDLNAFTGMGNEIIHNYDTVDYNRIWSLTQDEIPALRRSLEQAPVSRV
jgi:uncharacterized protein with HEPN domain